VVNAARKARDIADASLDLFGLVADQFSLGGQAVRARQTLNQANPEILLEHANAPSHGGMIDPQLVGRTRKAAGFSQREKEPEVIPVHACLRINAH
jgi:hypothetical protein